MTEELMLGDLFEEIAERLALARTKALMGEREEALGLLQSASLELTRFRDLLSGYPGFLALDHSLQSTLSALCTQQGQAEARAGHRLPLATGSRRRKADRAA